ncbi:MAG: phosphoribosyltransferase family protein [Oscillospiraceae bacterium]|nr:phosphoribosyltransferase family protein [Oscillospiraceae bacterium]
MSQKYTLHVAGLTRELTLCPVSDKLEIAAFIMFSDVELTVKCAQELLKKLPEFDVVLTSEAKGIPLAYELARQTSKTYVVARKSVKLYMNNPISAAVKSITTAASQMLYIDEDKAAMLRGKRVLIADDVISTGESLAALKQLAVNAGADICCSCAVLAEGDAADRDDIVYLEKLPLFFK